MMASKRRGWRIARASRQKIVDSWPMDCDDSSARKDWGWSPDYDKERCFAEYLVPNIKKRYEK